MYGLHLQGINFPAAPLLFMCLEFPVLSNRNRDFGGKNGSLLEHTHLRTDKVHGCDRTSSWVGTSTMICRSSEEDENRDSTSRGSVVPPSTPSGAVCDDVVPLLGIRLGFHLLPVLHADYCFLDVVGIPGPCDFEDSQRFFASCRRRILAETVVSFSVSDV